MRPALSTVTVYPTSVSSPAPVHIYNTPLADPPPCPIHTGPKHSILTHWEHRAPAHGQQGIISMYVLPPGVKKNKNKKRNIHNRKLCLSFLWVFWYDNCYAFKYNLQQPWAPWDCPYVYLQACKLPRCLQLSETEQGWVTEQWNKYLWLWGDSERVMRWMKKISTEALKK